LNRVSRRVSASGHTGRGLVEAIRRDYRTAPIEERDRVMLDFVSELTRDATRITPEHHARLRPSGSTTAAFSRSR
jgi:hypothetical protein